ncbi:hypothetical protein [Serratia fonticola]|uniref:hypothetical protein n=1 Tax=Serratia fonticola TaxID=47917 RepID=UPI001648CBA2|nr:hypothetical protein [Serratia fonticola]MBC3230105.1 hypothetical protein [Serratia fonticola]
MDNPMLIVKLLSESSGTPAAVFALYAAIAAGFIAAVASILVAFLNARTANKIKEAEYESSRKLKEAEFLDTKRAYQTEIYWEWLSSLQDFMNAPPTDKAQTNTAFKAFQKTSIKVIVQGDDELAKKMRDYYREITQWAISPNRETPIDHKKHHELIINLMREAQKMKGIGDIELICFIPKPAIMLASLYLG